MSLEENQRALDGEVKVTVASLSGTTSYNVEAGMTIADFREENDLEGITLVNAVTSQVLKDTDEIAADMEIVVSAPKKNGAVATLPSHSEVKKKL